MKDVYAVLREKGMEQSRLEKQVEALRVAAPLLSEDGETEDDNRATLLRAVNDTPAPDHSVGQDRGKNHWPQDSQSLFASSKTRCLGVPLERILSISSPGRPTSILTWR